MDVIATKAFVRSAKPLAKKYRSFNSDYQSLVSALTLNPHLGADLGDGFRKVRMAISSKGKGKSGGARVITFDAIERNGCLYLLLAYDKSEFDSVKLPVIKKMAADMGLL